MEKSISPSLPTTAIATDTAVSTESKSQVYLALISVQIFFGIHYYGAKVVLEKIPAPVWATLRIIGGAILMALICSPRLKNALPKRWQDWGALAIFALFGVVINQICFTEGLHRSLPTHSAIINTMIPVATLLFAIIMRKEKATLRKFCCIALSLSGVLYLLKVDQFRLDDQYLIGDLLTLTNSLSFSFFLVISKKLVMRYDPFVSTTILLIFGAIGITAYGSTSLLTFNPTKVPPNIWIWAAFIIIFPTVLAYLFNYWALKRVESSLVAFFIYIQPPLAATLSILGGYEQFSMRLVISALLIFSGFLLSYIMRN